MAEEKSLGMGLLTGAASAGIGGAIGMGIDAITAGARKRREKEMLKYQQQLSKENAQYEQGLAKEMWDYTSYPNQVKKLKEAGLSPALLYGNGGSGGTTSGAGSIGDSASGGVQDPMAAMGIGLQGQLTQSQIELNKAQANKLNTSAQKEGGIDTEEAKTRIENLKQGIKNQKTQNAINEIEKNLKNIEEMESNLSRWGRMHAIETQAKMLDEQYAIIANDAEISEETKQDKINQIKGEAIGAYIKNTLMRSEIRLNKQKEEEIIAGIQQKWAQISQGWVNLSQGERNTRVNEFKEEIKANYPTIWEVGGKAVNDFADGLNELMGAHDYKKHKIYKK